MILKLTREINRKVSDCMLAFMQYIGFSYTYFLLFWKRIFLFCIEKAKKKEK